MITSYDIESILLSDFHTALSIKCVSDPSVIDDFEKNGINEETAVIIVKKQTTETYWKKGFVEVNVCVPNYKNGRRNGSRLDALEGLVRDMLKTSIVGDYDGTTYRYSEESIAVERDNDMKCYYINVRLLFEIFNIV